MEISFWSVSTCLADAGNARRDACVVSESESSMLRRSMIAWATPTPFSPKNLVLPPAR